MSGNLLSFISSTMPLVEAQSLVLALLTIQVAATSLVVTWSRQPDHDGFVYNISLAVLIQECIKLFVSVLLLVLKIQRDTHPSAYSSDSGNSDLAEEDPQSITATATNTISPIFHTYKEIFNNNLFHMILPASLFVAQNHLLIEAASTLHATTYAVLSQIKLVSTVIFTVLILKRQLHQIQWASILLLFLGVVMVQASRTKVQVHIDPAVWTHRKDINGFLAIVAACTLSGYAGVYLEKLYKTSTVSIFALNAQMAICSVLPAIIMVFLNLDTALSSSLWEACRDLTRAFGVRAWSTIILNALGGFLVALTVRITSSLAKSFAISAALVITFPYSYFVLHETLPALRIFGATLVIVSMVAYNQAEYFSRQVAEGIPTVHSSPIRAINATVFQKTITEKGHLPFFQRTTASAVANV